MQIWRITLFLYLLAPSIFAQSTIPCGVSVQDGLLIKDRMLRNRMDINLAQIENLRAGQTYLPVTIHLVGNDAGQNYPSPLGALDALCHLNENYADQDIQFYIKDTLRYLNSSAIYNDGFAAGATSDILANKVPNCINMFVGTAVSQPVLGFYNPGGDYLWIKRSEMNPTAQTLSHEVGHFLSLMHTFFGWEDVPYESTYSGQQTPLMVGFPQQPVEYVARSGGNANCQTAADGFCDTPADYYSDRIACPFSGTAVDPDSAVVSPPEDNYMSYFLDNCINTFTPEQKGAIASDIIVRGWDNFPMPDTHSISGSSITTVFPVDQATDVSIDNDLVLDWNFVPFASSYYIKVERLFLGTPIEILADKVVTGTSYTIPAADLVANKEYIWSVFPFSQYSTCGSSADFSFRTADPIAVKKLEFQSVNFRILGNPVSSGQTAFFAVENQQEIQASLKIYSSNGQLLSAAPTQALPTGEHLLQMDLSPLTPGVYWALLVTENQTYYQQLVLK